MKQMQIRQKEAFLLSTCTLTPVPKKKCYIFHEKGSKTNMQGESFLTHILKLFL